MATKVKVVDVWTCKGRNGSGCGWQYVNDTAVKVLLEVSHLCKDGKRRQLTKDGKRLA